MVNDIVQVDAIIQAETSLSGAYYPNARDIDEVNQALTKYFLDDFKGGGNEGLERFKIYECIIEASSQANLKTALGLFNQMHSLNPSGYRLSTSNYPIWIEAQEIDDPAFKNENEFKAKIEIKAKWSV